MLSSVCGVSPTQPKEGPGLMTWPPDALHHSILRLLNSGPSSQAPTLHAPGRGEPQNVLPPDWMQVCAAAPQLAAARIRKNTDAAIVRGNAWILMFSP
jgi:hypothetical protein